VSTILGVCGYSGAGKTTFCREMARRFALPVLSTGEVVRRRVLERGLQLTPETIARVSDEIREETGGRFLRVLAPDLLHRFGGSPAVLLDCLREESDLLTARELADRVVLIAITAGDEVRAGRSLGRGRPGDPASRHEALALHAIEERLGVAQLLAGADAVLANDGDLGPFVERATLLVSGILARGGG